MDLQYWTRMALSPQDALSKEPNATDWNSTLKLWALTGLWAGLATGLGTLASQGITGLTLVAVFFSAVFAPFLYPIQYLLVEGFYYLVARFLGGTGSFLNHYHFTGLTARPILPLIALFISIPNPLSLLAGVAVSIYWLYPTTVAIRKVHGFDWTKAIFVWLLPAAVLGILGLLLLFLLFGILASSGALSALNATVAR